MSITDTRTDLEAVFAAAVEKKRVDPEVAKRIQEKSAESRKTYDREITLETLRTVRNDD